MFSRSSRLRASVLAPLRAGRLGGSEYCASQKAPTARRVWELLTLTDPVVSYPTPTRLGAVAFGSAIYGSTDRGRKGGIATYFGAHRFTSVRCAVRCDARLPGSSRLSRGHPTRTGIPFMSLWRNDWRYHEVAVGVSTCLLEGSLPDFAGTAITATSGVSPVVDRTVRVRRTRAMHEYVGAISSFF
jgi:hypothetical protein